MLGSCNHIVKQCRRKTWTPLSIYCSPYTMRPCCHEALVETDSLSEGCLVDPYRIQRLVESLPNPDRQKPLVVAFFGDEEKQLALKQLFPANDFKIRDRRNSLCKMYADALTLHAPHPILIADVDPKYGLPVHATRVHCHQFATRPMTGNGDSVSSALIIQRLLLPFFDVICIFSEDLGGLPGVLQHLRNWALAHVETAHRHHVGRILILIPDGDFDEIQAEIDAFTKDIAAFHLDRMFPTVRVETISYSTTRDIRYFALRKVLLLWELDAARATRSANMRLFSGLHLASFFSQCLNHTARSSPKPFNFLTASRLDMPHPPQFAECISAYLRAAYKHSIPYHVLSSPLATSLLMLAYPRSAHVFAPEEVFNAFFMELLTTCFERRLGYDPVSSLTFPHEKLRDKMLGRVREEFLNGWSVMHETNSCAAQIHKSTLAKATIRSCWKVVHSNLFCSICSVRRPEHVLKCRHAVCDYCTRIFGSLDTSEEYTYLFPICLCCGNAADLLIRLKPPTAGLRIMVLDGGGVAGIISMRFIDLLQKSLGSSCRVQDLFDLIVGTSVGGLEALLLFAKDWDVDSALNMFHRLAGRCFPRAIAGILPGLARVTSYIRCIINDSLYKAEPLEKLLRESFGEHLRLFDYPGTGSSHCKLAVTTTTTSNASTQLLTNYNGSLVKRSKCGYRVVRPEDPARELLMWQAGRATSAAPGLFPPLSVEGLGSFQDGALRHNNPVNIALWEADRIWSEATPRDVVLSLGTGSAAVLATPQSAIPQHTFSSRFIPRLCRSFMTSLDGDMTWRDLLNHVGKDAHQKYFRLNVDLQGYEPGLDDIKAIDRLSGIVDACNDVQKLGSIKLALLATCFFFELEQPPRLDASGFYVCKGEIRVRGNHTKILMALRQISEAPIQFFKDSISLGKADSAIDICSGCNKFRKKICFFIRHPSERLMLQVALGDHRHPISGFPQEMSWFAKEQGLTTPFYSESCLETPKLKCPCLKSNEHYQVEHPTNRGVQQTARRRSRRVESGNRAVIKGRAKRRRIEIV